MNHTVDLSKVADLEEPLLQPSTSGANNRTGLHRPNFWPCVANLTKVILGAGLMSIPKAYAMSGSVLGGLLMVLVGGLTWFTIQGLVYSSAKQSCRTYPELIRATCGNTAVKILDVAIIANSLGFEALYLDIISDVLLGNPKSPGILPGLLPTAVHQILLNRAWLLALVTFLVLAPLALRRHIGSLGAVNVVGLISVGSYGVALLWLGWAAMSKGQAHPLPVGPPLHPVGHDSMTLLGSAIATIPVILTADGCHQSVHPLMDMLKPYSAGVMKSVVAVTLSMATAFYITTSMLSCIIFGDSLEDDVLKNLNTPAMAVLIGTQQAVALSLTVRIGYVVSLLGSAALTMFPLRAAAMDLMYGENHGAHPRTFYPLTFSMLVLLYCLAVLVPSVWTVISFVGSVATTFVCFIFPATVIIMQQRMEGKSDALAACIYVAAGLVGTLGLMLAINGCCVLLAWPKALEPPANLSNSFSFDYGFKSYNG